MRLLIDILQGVGLSGAAGLRPFLPALVAGALARGDVGIDYGGTAVSFLQSPGWLLAMVLAVVVVSLLSRRGADLEEGPVGSALGGLGVGIGALLFAGTIDDRFDVWWPALAGGAVCAAVTGAAGRALLIRTRARLDPAAQTALPVYADGAALVLAAAAVLAPPLAVVAVAFLGVLLVRLRRRAGQKYAGLRILR